MNIYRKVFIGTLVLIFILISSKEIFYGYDQSTLLEDILKSIDNSVEEYNVVGSFYTKSSKRNIYEDIINKIENIIGQVDINSEDMCEFTINKGRNKYVGDISIFPYKNEYKVILSISIYGEELKISDKSKLETKVRKVLSVFSSNVEYSLCVKSKILNNTIDEVRDIVDNNLRLFKSKNTDEVKLNNGYSIIGYTGSFNRRVILGKNIDFNCAIVKYSSGCYLIMGEPEITINY